MNKPKTRHIILNGEEVRAVMDGIKTQMRFMVTHSDPTVMDNLCQICSDGLNWIFWTGKNRGKDHQQFTKQAFKPGDVFPCSYGRPGDLLWVRETFGRLHDIDGGTYVYRADFDPEMDLLKGMWQSPVSMTRNASRMTLKIKDVRAERLNDITESDAMAEGVERWIETRMKSQPTHYRIYYHEPGDDGTTYSSTAKTSFETLCQKKYGPDILDKNPFVWVIEFEKA